MESHTLIAWLVIGAIAGWLAGTFVKGGGFGLIGDIVVGIIGAFIGGSLPTIRNRWDKAEGDKATCTFFFQVWKPEAMNAGAFAS